MFEFIDFVVSYCYGFGGLCVEVMCVVVEYYVFGEGFVWVVDVDICFVVIFV